METATNRPEILTGLDTLLKSEDFDDDFLAPTRYATRKAQELLLATYRGRPDFVGFTPTFSTIGSGDIFIEWRRENREARVLVPPGPEVPIRLYYLEARSDGVESPVTPELLARRLIWVLGS